MHAVVRTYSGAGASELFDTLEERKDDIRATLQKVTGLVSYTLFRQGDGGMSVMVCADKAGTDESLSVARDWIHAHDAISVDLVLQDNRPVGQVLLRATRLEFERDLGSGQR